MFTVTDDTKKQHLDPSCGDKERDADVNKTSVAASAAAAANKTDDPVQKALGDFGWWQFWITFSLSLLKFPIAWHQLAIIFLAARSPFRCADDDYNGGGGGVAAFLANATAADRCSARDPLTHAVVPCQRFAYDRSIFQETIITEVYLTRYYT